MGADGSASWPGKETAVSSTNRGSKRSKFDLYETPGWTVKALFDSGIDLPSGTWVEPGCGTGNIVIAYSDWEYQKRNGGEFRTPNVNWYPIELSTPTARKFARRTGISPHVADFLKLSPPYNPFEVALGNPPFSLAQEFVLKALEFAKNVVFLLRMAFLESDKRKPLFDVIGVPYTYFLAYPRPKFLKGMGGDSTAYAWMHWRKDRIQRTGKFKVLYGEKGCQ